MLNIFAEALMLATRMSRLDRPVHHTRRSPREFQDIEGLRDPETPRSKGR